MLLLLVGVLDTWLLLHSRLVRVYRRGRLHVASSGCSHRLRVCRACVGRSSYTTNPGVWLHYAGLPTLSTHLLLLLLLLHLGLPCSLLLLLGSLLSLHLLLVKVLLLCIRRRHGGGHNPNSST